MSCEINKQTKIQYMDGVAQRWLNENPKIGIYGTIGCFSTIYSNKHMGFIQGWAILDCLQLETGIALGITVVIWSTGINWHLNAKH
jgi:hypothetical protein